MVSTLSKIGGIGILSVWFFLVLHFIYFTNWVEFVSEQTDMLAKLLPLLLFLSWVYIGLRVSIDIISVCDDLTEAVKAYKVRKKQ